jgi:hypothetical protein
MQPIEEENGSDDERAVKRIAGRGKLICSEIERAWSIVLVSELESRLPRIPSIVATNDAFSIAAFD